MPSIVIEHISYEPQNKKLKVYFKSGAVYLYEEVTEKIYKEFAASLSKGSYLNRKLKKLYEGKKITGGAS